MTAYPIPQSPPPKDKSAMSNLHELESVLSVQISILPILIPAPILSQPASRRSIHHLLCSFFSGTSTTDSTTATSKMVG